jgi:hypothetical protein
MNYTGFDVDDPNGGIYRGRRRIGYFPASTDGGFSPLAMPAAPSSATNEVPPPTSGAVSSSNKDAAQKHELTGAERLGKIGSALQDFANGFAGLERRPQDTAALEAMQRQLQQQQELFAQQVKFGQMPGPYRPVAPPALNPPGIAAARPGDRALGALASLYR